MKVTIYGTPCKSMQKAKKWFDKHEISYTERNIRDIPMTVEELRGVLRLTLDGTDEIISTRSNIYKQLNLDFDTLPLQELLTLIQKHPGLLRNPIIIDDRRIQVGYNEDDIRQFLPRKARELEWLKLRMKQLYVAEDYQ